MVFQNDIIAGASGAGGGYEIDQSIRFNDNDSAYLTSGTFGTATNQYIWTFSWWGKRGVLGTYCTLVSTNTSANDAGRFTMRFDQTTNVLMIGGYNTNWRYTSRVFRDPSAWLHIVVKVDTTQATAADRLRLYINGVEETAFTTNNNPAQNTTIGMNTAGQHQIGRDLNGGGFLYDGYMAEINFIDGQALAPTSFGETNNDGVWVPKAYAGTYGTNGFYITGEDSADLGADYSGNGNDFTSSGLTADDQMLDTPTNNFVTLNLLYSSISGSYPIPALSEGNLAASTSDGANWRTVPTTIYMDSGKWYSEVRVTYSDYPDSFIGFASSEFNGQNYAPSETAFGYQFHPSLGIRHNSTQLSAQTFTQGDIIGLALNMDDNEIKFYKNGSLLYTATSVAAGSWSVALTLLYTKTLYSNFGQDSTFAGGTTAGGNADANGVGDFKYTVPSGFLALCTANLPGPAIADGSAYFQATTYTGAGYPTEVNQLGNSTFQPDFVWAKRRNAATQHGLFDAVRGTNSLLRSQSTDAELTASTYVSFDADGWSALADPIQGDTASSGNTFVSWQWLAGNGTASNTDGDFTSTVSANQTAGFSVLTWTGNGTSTVVNSIGHGLGKAPSLIIMRRRSPADDWFVYAEPITQSYYLRLNSNAAQAFDTGNNTWGGTAPTSSVFYTEAIGSAAYNYVAYCFAEVEGFSKFGKYTGNGSTNGPFIFTGFRPAFVMFKKTSGTDSWEIFDNTRPGYNATGLGLFPNTTDSELTGRNIDILSNGIKQRNANGTTNQSGYTYIYMAFAENPFGGDGVAPATAR